MLLVIVIILCGIDLATSIVWGERRFPVKQNKNSDLDSKGKFLNEEYEEFWNK